MEEFQGQERGVIIVSTVRSKDSGVGAESSSSLGFLHCEKRFNVAVTRAKSLLIVVGDPHLLSEDEVWLEFLKYCSESGCVRGCDLPPAVREPQQPVIKKMKKQTYKHRVVIICL